MEDDMKKFTILIDRITYTSTEVCVVAEDETAAHEEAYRLSGDIDFSDKKSTIEYETTTVDEEPT